MSPRYGKDEWGDEGYDAVDHLIDNDPMELASWFRRMEATLRPFLSYPFDHEGELVVAVTTARSLLDECDDLTRETEVKEPW